ETLSLPYFLAYNQITASASASRQQLPELTIIEPSRIGNQTALDHFAREIRVRRPDVDDSVAPRLSQRRLAIGATQSDDYDRVWDRVGEPREGVSPFWICFDIVD